MAVTDSWYVESIKFIEENGMFEFLKSLNKSRPHRFILNRIILNRIKEKYPKEKDKIKLWETLHPE